jgi:hypothetical protein
MRNPADCYARSFKFLKLTKATFRFTTIVLRLCSEQAVTKERFVTVLLQSESSAIVWLSNLEQAIDQARGPVKVGALRGLSGRLRMDSEGHVSRLTRRLTN